MFEIRRLESEKMTNTLLAEGPNVSYDDLTERLKDGEVLVATWQLSHSNHMPHARPVNDEADLTAISTGTRNGHYAELRWFASTTGSRNPRDYAV